MIIGIGTDLVEIARISGSLTRFGERFAQRILDSSELESFRLSQRPAHFLSRRFAAKEAAAKALGTGMSRGVTFRQFIIRHLATGAPVLELTGRALELAGARGVEHLHLSISDERSHAIAVVVLEGEQPGRLVVR